MVNRRSFVALFVAWWDYLLMVRLSIELLAASIVGLIFLH
jgi:hypothetical protein